jgi:hypothetical protein
VSVIDTATNTIVATIPVGATPKSYGRFVAKGPPPADLPDPPTNVVATAGAGSASVAFDSPANTGGAPITRYTATCGAQHATGSVSPLTVTGLSNGVSVTCTVVATNTAGDSVPSDPSNAVTPVSVPDAPTITSVVRGDGRVTVAYAAPANNGSPIQGYIINCGTMNVFGGNNPLPVTGLPNGVPVTCRMRARNGVGDGPWSADSAPVTPAGLPAAPLGAVATRGNGEVGLAFEPGDTGGLPVTYTARCGTQTASGPASPLVVTGLANGTSVTCEVWGTNDVGAGAHLSANAVTPATVPDAPTITNAVRGDGKVTVTFTAPASDGGDPVQGYLLTCGGQTVWGGNLTLPVSNLANGVAVTCVVKARNGVGDSAASAPSNPVTPATTPAAPTLTAVTAGDASAQLAFAAPADTGGLAIDGYRATCTPGTHTATGAVSPLTVPGLANGQTYTCSVTAQNDVGFGASSDGMTVVPRFVADVAVTIDNGVRFIPGGGETSYLVEVRNGASRAVSGVRVRATLDPALANATWICAGQGGSTCPANGSGDIDATVDLAANGSVGFLVDATVAALPEAPVTSSAAITAPNDVADPASANDGATDGPDAVGLFASGFESP